MNLSNKLTLSFVVVLIIIAVSGLFEERALKYVSGIFENNLRFLSLVSETKMIVAGLSSIKIPFIEGITKDLNESLAKVQQFLLVTDVISFLQVLILSISKSWIIKVSLVALLLLSFVKGTKKICSKILILSLALNPGLAIFSVGVQELSKAASIDFGDSYIKKLKTSVAGIKGDKAKLMQQHASQMTQIKNGKKGVHLLKGFKEDISYDFKKAKGDIKGAHQHIRLLIHEAGHEMTSKIFGFGSMVIFSMILMPLGYGLIIYLLFNSLFKANHLPHLAHLGDHPNALTKSKADESKSSFMTKLNNVYNIYLKEFHSIEQKVEHSGLLQKAKSEIEQIENQVEHSSLLKKGEADFEKVENKVETEVKQAKKKDASKVAKVKAKISDEMNVMKTKVTDDVSQANQVITSQVSQVENKVEMDASRIKGQIESKVGEVGTQIGGEMNQIRTNVSDDVSKAKQMIATRVGQVENKVGREVDKVEEKKTDLNEPPAPSVLSI
ncbi:MAG: apolipoprotein A1/A4/E family protein [Flavobacteriales bacterium]|nr:apolipoprotein A1/A4/E family protein [Flavobacteriales bacterium]